MEEQDLRENLTADAQEQTPVDTDKTDETPQEPYVPRPLGLRILAWVLAITVVIGMILYYYNFFTAG